MRVTDRALVQLLDADDPAHDKLIFIDPEAGGEVIVPRQAWPVLQHAITYLTGDQHAVTIGEHSHDYRPTQIGTDANSRPIRVPACGCGGVGGITTGGTP